MSAPRRSAWRKVLLAPLYVVVALAAFALLSSLISGFQALYDASESVNSASDTRDITADVTGRVRSVADGDTFLLETTEGVRLVVRVAEIDAPEQDQPFGDQSKRALTKLVSGRSVQLLVQTTDTYGRAVARPYVGTTDVSAEMIASGSAWVYRHYQREARLSDLERAAKQAKKGLWALPAAQRQPPWEWRRTHPRKG
ncbi:MAG: thermonuclease family protein [Pseudomonadales bacterium]